MDYKELLQQLMYLVITGILPVVTLWVVTFLKTKIQDTTAEMESKQLEKYINSATEAIGLAVISTSQTYVDSMKNAGKFDSESQKIAKDMALNKAKELITQESRNAIEIVYRDFEKYLDDSIEAMVRESKIEPKNV